MYLEEVQQLNALPNHGFRALPLIDFSQIRLRHVVSSMVSWRLDNDMAFFQVIVLSAGAIVDEAKYWEFVHHIMHNLEVYFLLQPIGECFFPAQDTLKDILHLPGTVAQWLGNRAYVDALEEVAEDILQRQSQALVDLRKSLRPSARASGKKIEGSKCAKQRMAYAVNAMRKSGPVAAAAAAAPEAEDSDDDSEAEE
jgi:hypothetical protein